MKTLKRNRKGEFAEETWLDRTKRFVFWRITTPVAIIGLVIIGYQTYRRFHPEIVYTAQALVENSTDAAEILAKRFVAEQVDVLKDELVIKLSDECEVKDIPEDEKDGKITFDPSPSGKAEPASIGRWQFKVKTVQLYWKKFHGDEITSAEAIAIATDPIRARELARTIIFEEVGGIWNWENCANRLALPQEIELIRKLQEKLSDI